MITFRELLIGRKEQDTFLKFLMIMLSGRDLSEIVMDASKFLSLLDKVGNDDIKRILEQATPTGVMIRLNLW